jgi:hypothetical protein
VRFDIPAAEWLARARTVSPAALGRDGRGPSRRSRRGGS